MKTDGSILIDTKIVDGGMEKGFELIKDEMSSIGITAKEVGEQIELSFSKMDVSKPIANAVAKVQQLEQQLATVTSDYEFEVSEGDDKSVERLYAKRKSVYERLEAAREKLSIELASAVQKEAAAEEKATQRKIKAAEKEAAAKKRAQEKQFSDLTKPARRFNSRLREILSGALVFNLISSGLRSVTNYFGSALKSNNEFTASFAQLKGALLTAFQPIYEFVAPAIIYLMKLLTAAAQAVGRFFASLFGKSYSQMQKNAEALYNQANAIDGVGSAAKEASKQLAGFDEINRLESTSQSGGGGSIGSIQPQFSDGLDVDEYKTKIDELTLFLSGALLALGAILAFSGANVPLGIGLMAAGAYGLGKVISENWDVLTDGIEKEASDIKLMLSGAILALGAILAFSGANIPLGIGMMAAGALSIGTEIMVNWNSVKEAMQGPVGGLVAFLSGALLAMGAILLFSGANVPLGLGMMLAGAAGLATAIAPNWNWILEKLQKVGQDIKDWGNGIIDYFSTTFENGIWEGIGTLWDDIVNWAWQGLTNIFSILIESWNRFWDNLFGGNFARTRTPDYAANYTASTAMYATREIPQLARGAVIPPNKKFLAILGDQTNGRNLEAPEDLIRQIVREESGAGNSDRLAQLLETLIAVVEGIEVGDEVIGKAAARYNRSTARARGY